jgi:hypothetical protein
MGIHRLTSAPFLAASLSKTARFLRLDEHEFQKPDLSLRANQRADFGNHCLHMIRLEEKTATCRQIRPYQPNLTGPDDSLDCRLFGEGCLAGEALRLSTVSALTKCTIARISKADITRVIHEEPAFAELFISHLLARNSRVEEDLVDQLFNSSEKRLARTLLLLANFGKESRPEPIIAKVSQETLAEMIGTTRSRVSFFMNKFRKLGLIDYNGSIEIHSSLLNVVLRGQPHIKGGDG